MNTNKNHVVSASELEAGRTKVAEELAEAQAAFDAAAFKAAANPDEITRAALSQARANLQSLQDESKGLDAVEREVRRQAAVKSVIDEIALLDEEVGDARNKVEAVIPAFQKAMNLILELGESLDALHAAEESANAATIHISQKGNGRSGDLIDAPRAYQTRPLIGSLYWLATHRYGEIVGSRSEMVMTVGGEPEPSGVWEAMRYSKSRALARIDKGGAALLSAANKRRDELLAPKQL